MRLNLTHLYQFYMTAKEGSIKNASKSLHITEPTISKQIKELEKFFEFYLFRRVKNHLELTDKGQELMEKSEKIFQSVEEVEFAFGALSPSIKQNIKIGSSPLFYSSLFHFFDFNFSDTRIHNPAFFCLNPPELGNRLAEKSLDIVVSYDPLSSKEYYCKKVLEFPMLLVGKKEFLDLFNTPPTQNTKIPMVFFNEKYSFQEDLQDFFFSKNMDSEVHFLVDSFEASLKISLLGHAISFVPEPLVQKDLDEGRLSILMKTPEISLPIWGNVLKSRRKDPLIRAAFEKACSKK